MIKIFYDYKIFLNQKYEGPSRYFLSLIDSIDNTQFDCLVNSPVFFNEYLNQFKKKNHDLVKGRFQKKKYRYTHTIIKLYNHFISTIDLNSKNYDIYHPTYYGKGLINFKKKPLVLTVYDLIHEKFQADKISGTINDKKPLLKRASKIICISENTRRDLLNLYNIDKNKLLVIYPGVKNIFLEENKKEKLLLTKPYILFVGNRTKYKNSLNFLKAYANSKKLKNDFNIVFFGGVNFSILENNDLLKLGIKLNNVFYEDGDDNKLKLYYENANVLIYPSLYEGFGLVPLEAMSYGCPVVSSNTSCLPEVQGDASLKFDPNSIDDIQYALEKVLYSQTLSKELISKGYKKIKKYSWSECARETTQLYNELT